MTNNQGTKKMNAFHGSQTEKDAVLAQIQAHYDADEIIKGTYWENGRGCAVGCIIHSRDHAEFTRRWDIPEVLPRLADVIFEGMPIGPHREWPMRFMSAIQPGADLSRVGWQFLHRILLECPGRDHPLVAAAVTRCTDLIGEFASGDPVSAARAAYAARAAGAAAEAAARAAEAAAEAAARAAYAAARAAAGAAYAAAGAAWAAARAAGAAWAASAADWAAADAAARARQADILEELLKAAGASQ